MGAVTISSILEMLAMPFVIKAFICGTLIGAICAWLGIFVTLNKMAFFSESISHASITGIAISIWLSFDPSIFLIFFSVFMAGVIAFVSQSSFSSKDSVIGIIHSATIAIGIILLSFLKGGNTDLSRYPFGDIMAIRQLDIIICVALFIATVIYLLIFGKTHVITCLLSDFSVLEGISTPKYDFMLMIVLSLIIAVSVKIVGAILVTALLIIPSNAAKNITTSFKKFSMLSIKFGILGAVLGIFMSVVLDLPTGPSIIVVNALFYFITLGLRNYLRFSF